MFCGICNKELTQGSNCMLLYSKAFPQGPYKLVSTHLRLHQGEIIFQGDGLCFCSMGLDKSFPPGAILMHFLCYYLFFGSSSPTRGILHHRRNRLATAMTFRGFDKAPFNRHYMIRFPQDISVDAFLETAAQFGFGRLQTLPNEVIFMIIRLYGGSPFLEAVQVMATALYLRALPFTRRYSWCYLSEVVSWRRGQVLPTLARGVQLGPVRITLDPRGICRIDHETGGIPSHTQHFVHVAEPFVEGVKLYFKDGLAYLKRPQGHRWFNIDEPPSTQDTDMVSHVTRLCPLWTSTAA
ncbi:hypothetical protein CEP54_014069 [Fusarium duplospermum]|uniref:Uncharacterized protein n=1 Tax=Fusarium duplospermum TaxID=1325734 RepID=A0A428NYL0_9HYPO|nr:hypothetical protein CEP54_014069 [Fusarium duplospermum]